MKEGQDTKTWTFGTGLCSEDPDAEIVIDEVRYDTVPELPPWSPEENVPSIGTRLRLIPPTDESERKAIPIIAVKGGPEKLPGEVVDVGDGAPITITQPCDGYQRHTPEDHPWPIVEVLTVLTVGPEGGLVRRTHLDYHVGDDEYTITWKWKVGICGTAVPAGNGCGKPKGRPGRARAAKWVRLAPALRLGGRLGP